MFKPIDIKDIPERKPFGRHNRNAQDILSFARSSALAAEVSIPEGKKPRNVAQCYAVAAKRIGCGVTVIQRGGRVFLIKEGGNA